LALINELIVPGSSQARDLVEAHRGLTLPRIIAQSGPRAARRFVEFFTAELPNQNTRAAYARAVRDFCAWCETNSLDLASITPVAMAAYMQQHAGSVPTRKQHLAAIRHLFDYWSSGTCSTSIRRMRFADRNTG
jgi:hypothetical protein